MQDITVHRVFSFSIGIVQAPGYLLLRHCTTLDERLAIYSIMHHQNLVVEKDVLINPPPALLLRGHASWICNLVWRASQSCPGAGYLTARVTEVARLNLSLNLAVCNGSFTPNLKPKISFLVSSSATRVVVSTVGNSERKANKDQSILVTVPSMEQVVGSNGVSSRLISLVPADPTKSECWTDLSSRVSLPNVR